MKLGLVLAPLALLGSGPASAACSAIAFGTFKVGQMVPQVGLKGIPGTCATPDECVYNERSGIEYVVSRNTVVKVSAPVRIVRGLLMPGARIDAAYARRLNRKACRPFRLQRDDGGQTYLETAERIDPVSRVPLVTLIYHDERATPIVAITSLPDD